MRFIRVKLMFGGFQVDVCGFSTGFHILKLCLERAGTDRQGQDMHCSEGRSFKRVHWPFEGIDKVNNGLSVEFTTKKTGYSNIGFGHFLFFWNHFQLSWYLSDPRVPSYGPFKDLRGIDEDVFPCSKLLLISKNNGISSDLTVLDDWNR